MKKSLLTILSLALALPSFGQESMQKQTSFRELLFSGKNKLLFLSPSETETIIVGGFFSVNAGRAIEYCSAFGGKAYLVKYKQVEGFGGGYVIEEKKPAEAGTGLGGFLKGAFTAAILGDVASSNAPATLCEKDGKEVFFIQKGRFIGYRYPSQNQWLESCFIQVARHQPEPRITSFELEWADKIKASTNLIEFLQSNRVKLQTLPDGSYKIKNTINNNCHPLNSDVLRMLASYCYQKGGTFRTADGRDFKDFMARLLTTDLPPDLRAVNYWLRQITGTTYYCDGPEKFMVRTTAERSASDIQTFIIPYVHYVKLGLDERLNAQAQTRVSQPTPAQNDALISMIKMTASSKMPSMQVMGQMQYETIYMYPDGGCDLVALITRGPGYTTVDNYKICQNDVQPVGRSDDYKVITVDRIDPRTAMQLYTNCRSYGRMTSLYSGYRIDCRIPNPQLPCNGEILITRDNKLVDFKVENICR
ncbi:hypothetical protein [Thermocrinis sp.]|jgi:hypothetical protein|uniref:hypothetical protein n=1 Tax=Thermocrinis sp. TaxID=2024383 RepID=UPI003C115BD0